jgi:hypothetical protein
MYVFEYKDVYADMLGCLSWYLLAGMCMLRYLCWNVYAGMRSMLDVYPWLNMFRIVYRDVNANIYLLQCECWDVCVGLCIMGFVSRDVYLRHVMLKCIHWVVHAVRW